MASFTINGGATFPEGTSVSVYPRSAWGVESTSGAPTGSAASGPVTITGGVATFTGLADGTTYIAYGNSRTKSFSTPAVPATAGIELGFVEKADADFTTSTVNTFADVTGLQITVTVDGARPFVVEAGGSILKESATTGVAEVALVQVGTGVIQKGDVFGAANSQAPWHIARRRALTAGTYTFKVQLAQSAGVGTATLGIGADHPAWLRAILV
jgi:hypothetical protein